jgi:hypothetical protein
MSSKKMLGELRYVSLWGNPRFTSSGYSVTPSEYYIHLNDGKVIQASRVNYSRHNIAGTRLDVWFYLNGIIYYGVQYGFYNSLHYRATKYKHLPIK